MKIWQDQESKETLLLMNIRKECEGIPMKLQKQAIRKTLLSFRTQGHVTFLTEDLSELTEECFKRIWG